MLQTVFNYRHLKKIEKNIFIMIKHWLFIRQ